MSKIKETLQVPLSAYQSRILARLRPSMPSGYTEEDLHRYIVTLGFLSAVTPDDIPVVDASEPTEPRPLDESITLKLEEPLRARLERLLGLRPDMATERALSLLLELGLETLIELGVVREQDVGSAEISPSAAFREVE
jgi:hypothetical protein